MTWGKFQIQLIVGDLPRYCQDSGEKAVCLCNLEGALSKALCSLCLWLCWRGELSDKLSHNNAVRWGLSSTKQQITATVWMFSRPVCSAERCLFPVSFKNRASSFQATAEGILQNCSFSYSSSEVLCFVGFVIIQVRWHHSQEMIATENVVCYS